MTTLATELRTLTEQGFVLLPEVLTAEMPAGSEVILDGATWHRGGANRSTGTRLATSPQDRQPWLRPRELQLPVAPEEIAESLPPRMRQA